MAEMTVRAILGAVAVVAVVAATPSCGGGGERKYVAAYIDNVNAIEKQMRVPLDQMVRTYASFSTRGSSLAIAGPRLEHALQTLRTLDRRLRKLDAPPKAAKLHKLVLGLVDSQIGLARELDRLAEFLPRFGAVLSHVGPANKHLAAALAASPTPRAKTVRGTRNQIKAKQAEYAREFAHAAEAQAAAIENYRDDLSVVLHELRAITPPAVLRPTYETELSKLARLRATGEVIAQALRNAQYSRIPALNRSFVAASRTAATLTAQRAQIAAIKAYDARVRALNTVAARIQREQTGLERSLR